MNNLTTVIENYVRDKHARNLFSDRTVPVVLSVIRTLAPDINDPARCFKQLRGKGYGLYTIKTYFNYVATFESECLNTSRFRIYLETNKSAFKNCYKEKRRNLKPEQYAEFLAMYENTNANMFNLLVLMGQAGLRISEAMNARWEDLKDDMLWVIGKGSKQRVIPFERNKLQGKGTSGKIVGTLAFSFLFKRDMAPFTPHDLRSFFATQVSNHPELSMKDAQTLLGHASITTTSRYVRSDMNRIAKVLKKKS